MPIGQREPTNYPDNCYFGLVKLKGFYKTNIHFLRYPGFSFAIRLIAHCEKIHVIVFGELPDKALSIPINIEDENNQIDIFEPFNIDFDQTSLCSHLKLNDLSSQKFVSTKAVSSPSSPLVSNHTCVVCIMLSKTHFKL